MMGLFASGLDLIAAERSRQQRVEGYTRTLDSGLKEGVLAQAASVYALPPGRAREQTLSVAWPLGWPFKPKNRKRDLVRAGALIAAELDRLLAIERRERHDDTDWWRP